MSYDPMLPTQRDRIRLAVGDIDTTSEWLPDETYDAVIAAATSERAATLQMAKNIVTVISQDPDRFTADDGTSIAWGERVKTLLALISRLKAELDGEASAAGGATASTRTYRERISSAEYRRDYWHQYDPDER